MKERIRYRAAAFGRSGYRAATFRRPGYRAGRFERPRYTTTGFGRHARSRRAGKDGPISLQGETQELLGQVVAIIISKSTMIINYSKFCQ